MTMLKSRLERLEKEQRFQMWYAVEDALGRFTQEEREAYATTGRIPESLPFDELGRLDGLDRKTLLKLFEEHQRFTGSVTRDDAAFYLVHRRFPREETVKHMERYFKRTAELLKQARRPAPFGKPSAWFALRKGRESRS